MWVFVAIYIFRMWVFIINCTVDLLVCPSDWLGFMFCRDERREFIQSKYVRRAFVQPTTASQEELQQQLCQAINKNDLLGLLKVYFQVGFLKVNKYRKNLICFNFDNFFFSLPEFSLLLAYVLFTNHPSTNIWILLFTHLCVESCVPALLCRQDKFILHCC